MVEKLINTGIGRSLNKNALSAGKEAAKKAITELGVKADIILVLASSNYAQKELIKGVNSVIGKTPMIGGTTAGEISNKGFSDNSITVLALQSKKIKLMQGIGKGIKKDAFKAGVSLVKSIKEKGNITKGQTLMIFSDSLSGDGLEIIRGIQSIIGEDFEIVGGALGDEAKFKKTYQYYNGKVITNSVVGLMLIGSVFTATGVRSGWVSLGNRIKCTEAKGNVIKKLDGKPALDVYSELLGKERAKKMPSIGLEYPLGMIDEKAKIGGKEYFQIRCPLAIDKKKKTVTMAAAIPEGKEVTLTLASRDDVIKGSKLAAEQAKKLLGKRKPKLILMFSCVARKMVLGNRINEEIKVVQKILGEKVPIYGFYTYGEIGPIDKKTKGLLQTRWHNETVVLWVLAE